MSLTPHTFHGLLRHLSRLGGFLSLALIACVALPKTAVANCSDEFFKLYDTRPNSIQSRDFLERGSCSRRKQASRASDNYVIYQNRLFFRHKETHSSSDCVIINPLVVLGKTRPECLLNGFKTTYTTNSFFPLQFDPDPTSFRLLAPDYAVADGKVYYQQFMIQDAQPRSAETPLRPVPDSDDYVVYGDQVFFKDRLVRDADGASFQKLPFEQAGRDKARVYFGAQMLDDSDPASFAAVPYDIFPRYKDKLHQWRNYTERMGVVAEKLPEDAGGGFFKTRYTSPEGQSYWRIQWAEKAERADSAKEKTEGYMLFPLPMRMSEGDEFVSLPEGCPGKTGTLGGHPGMSCAQFDYLPDSDFGRTNNKIFFRDWVVQDADVASFQVFNIHHSYLTRTHGTYAWGIDSRNLYLFGADAYDDYSKRPWDTVALQGEVTGPIPNKYGDFQLVADAADIHDLPGDTFGDDSDLCRYDNPPSTREVKVASAYDDPSPTVSTRGLKVISRDEGRDGLPWIVLANDRYQYVFYLPPTRTSNPSYVMDLRTNQRLRMFKMFKDGKKSPCGLQ